MQEYALELDDIRILAIRQGMGGRSRLPARPSTRPFNCRTNKANPLEIYPLVANNLVLDHEDNAS